MSKRKEMAMAMLKDMPEEKIEFVIEFFQQLETRTGRKEKKLTPKIKAFNQLENIRKNFPENIVIDYDRELAEARDEKYNSAG
ncbi:MAG: hypothetical protein OSJ45_12465 [Lachnospiraceae bacterium]|nr:hypothetical protein [Lachnospiraceae bacterium]